ncbi:MAG: transposase [Candidatus Omnitrophica bacterium]|nr:transposase [Candidatus Omnitrophota bacterium]
MDGLRPMPKGTRNIRFLFEGTHLTHFGGMALIHRFCKKIHLKKRIQKSLERHYPHDQSQYHSSELILALLYAIIMGLKRINKTEILQYNGFFLEILGLSRFPDQTTLRRFLKRLSPQAIRQLARLHDSLRAHLWGLPNKRTSLIFG